MLTSYENLKMMRQAFLSIYLCKAQLIYFDLLFKKNFNQRKLQAPTL